MGGGFEGSLVFSQSASGKQEELITAVMPSEIRISIGKEAYRQDEIGGANEGGYVIKRGATMGLRINHGKRTTMQGSVTSPDLEAEEMKKFKPGHFKTEMLATGEKVKIAGYETEKFEVTSSAFLRPGATMKIWIAKDLELGRHRYDFTFPGIRVVSPIPLLVPVAKGAILKAVIIEHETTMTIIATEVKVGSPTASLFEKPEGYVGPDVPPVPKILPAMVRKEIDSARLKTGLKTGLELEGLRFLLVKPGNFQMGSLAGQSYRRKDERRHEVLLKHHFYLSQTEVTQAQWKSVMGVDSFSKFKGDFLPVDSVTWHQAREFCKKLSEKSGYSVRLPTEAEWEYAARAGGEKDPADSTQTYRAWLQQVSWMSDNAERKTHPVGRHTANAWGFHDMLGNVAEWTLSGYGDYPESEEALIDPRGTDALRKVVRGGSWMEAIPSIRFAHRSHQEGNTKRATLGFRVVAEAK